MRSERVTQNKRNINNVVICHRKSHKFASRRVVPAIAYLYCTRTIYLPLDRIHFIIEKLKTISYFSQTHFFAFFQKK